MNDWRLNKRNMNDALCFSVGSITTTSFDALWWNSRRVYTDDERQLSWIMSYIVDFVDGWSVGHRDEKINLFSLPQRYYKCDATTSSWRFVVNLLVFLLLTVIQAEIPVGPLMVSGAYWGVKQLTIGGWRIKYNCNPYKFIFRTYFVNRFKPHQLHTQSAPYNTHTH